MEPRENEEGPEHYRFQVPPELDGQRLDRVLSEGLAVVSRERFKEVIQDGGVTIDGTVETRGKVAMAAGTWIEVVLALRDRTRAGSQAGATYELLHEDEAILVVAKPAGMVVHPSERVRGGTLSELLAETYPGLPTPQGEDRPGIVHRLDAETSGVLVVARTEAAGVELKRQFAAREVKKTYCTIVYGEPRFDSDYIDKPIGRGKGSERVMILAVEEGGRPSETFYRTVERLGVGSYLECEPRTGRTHQIRVHLESIGHPVVGDKLYRGKRTLRLPRNLGGKLAVDRHLLHAFRLEFTHPVSGERVAFEAPLPADMVRVLERLRLAATSDES
ncbi:MAG: RluA family pseudouridine synthase [Planctomycetota bacterium]|nr:RluA family pseudouridine synthase [Planctomycetota bacterium]